LPVLYFTVTTDLTYDQRMIRICTSLANAGYNVVLVGRAKKGSLPLVKQPFQQKRISCLFEKGKSFYIEYNLRLLFYLLFKKMDGICAIDLDTILPCYYIASVKKVNRIYDAHELFCEMKEIVSRPKIYKIWKWIEQKTVPHFKYGYTVNKQIADEFEKMYDCKYQVIRSIALYDFALQEQIKEKFILYQGAVNEGRSFETLIPAMQWVNAQLVICGDGNFMEQAKKLAADPVLDGKVIFKGMVEPKALKEYTSRAYIGITLFEKDSKSNYFSLANRFFDYIHAATPQLCVDYPVYREINDQYSVAVLTDDLKPAALAMHLNSLLDDKNKWQRMRANCMNAAKELNWQNEEINLLAFYKNIFG
jgi:glycosyltransferase involved in cell wall biosynthesis